MPITYLRQHFVYMLKKLKISCDKLNILNKGVYGSEQNVKKILWEYIQYLPIRLKKNNLRKVYNVCSLIEKNTNIFFFNNIKLMRHIKWYHLTDSAFKIILTIANAKPGLYTLLNILLMPIFFIYALTFCSNWNFRFFCSLM